jgi:hypothetical protein
MRNNKGQPEHDDSQEMDQPGRSKSNRPKGDDGSGGSTRDLKEANENIRKAEGDDSTATTRNARKGNRPAFDRDR